MIYRAIKMLRFLHPGTTGPKKYIQTWCIEHPCNSRAKYKDNNPIVLHFHNNHKRPFFFLTCITVFILYNSEWKLNCAQILSCVHASGTVLHCTPRQRMYKNCPVLKWRLEAISCRPKKIAKNQGWKLSNEYVVLEFFFLSSSQCSYANI